MPHPKFEVKPTKGDQIMFNLTASNGQIILTSEQYTTKAACLNGVESVQSNGTDDSKYDRLIAKNDQFYFNLKATNGQVIGTSEMYITKAAMENGIDSVKTNSQIAEVEEVG